MRDVTKTSPEQNPYHDFKNKILIVFHFLKHPMQEVKNLPDWNWSTLTLFLAIFSIGSGVLFGLIPPNFYRILGGFTLAPAISFFMTGLLTVFFYYYFQIFERRTVDFRRLYTLVIFSNFPFFIFQIGSQIVPPLTLVGFAMTSAIIAVGLTENFQMEKRRAIRLVLFLLAIVFLIWLKDRIDMARLD